MAFLPILSKAQFEAENEMMKNVKDPREMKGLINRWLVEYLPNLEPGKFHPLTHKALKKKYMVALKMAVILREYENLKLEEKTLFQEVFSNEKVYSAALNSDSGISASTRSSGFTTPPRMSSTAVSISQTWPSASSATCSTTPTRWSDCKKFVARRINYNCADPRKRLLRAMSREGEDIQSISSMDGNESVASYETTSSGTTEGDRTFNASLPQFNSPLHAATSTPMRVPALPYAAHNDDYTMIGPNGTKVLSKVFRAISFSSPSTATRSLLCLVFSEEILAKNTLSGKPSPAFRGRGRPPKGQLNPDKISDIIHCVTSRTTFTEHEVRCIITTKCADSTKKFRRLNKISES
nr:uncharacterized protein LOC106614776 isoform X4 [Bactrocera oleae]